MNLPIVPGLVHVPRNVQVAGTTLQLWEWPENKDRKQGWSGDVRFLAVADNEGAFLLVARIFCSPFPNAICASCRTFDEMVALVDLVRAPLLVTINQNLLWTVRQPAEALNKLLGERDWLRLLLHSGCSLDFLIKDLQYPDRIDFANIPRTEIDFWDFLFRHFDVQQPSDFGHRGRGGAP